MQSLGDTFLVARLALLLWSYLGPCGRWFFKFLRLLMYTCFLLPGFIQVGLSLTQHICCQCLSLHTAWLECRYAQMFGLMPIRCRSCATGNVLLDCVFSARSVCQDQQDGCAYAWIKPMMSSIALI